MWYSALIGGLLQVVGSFVGRAFIAMGLGVVAYKGMDTSVAWAKDRFFTSVDGLPATAVQVLGVLEVDTSVEMLLSAIVMRLLFKGMTAGVMKSFKLK
jgi:Protein of unknown function (DUF2523)